MLELCQLGCCEKCQRLSECGGCKNTQGHPFGGTCVAAECIKSKGIDAFFEYKQRLIKEFNNLGLEDLHVDDLFLLNGFHVNLEYELSNHEKVKLLADNNVYLGNQVEKKNSGRCYGLIADDSMLLVSEFGSDGTNPEIIILKKRLATNL